MARQRLSRKSQNPQELLRKALRFETSLRETLEENPFLFEEEYVITWDDLYALLSNLKEKVFGILVIEVNTEGQAIVQESSIQTEVELFRSLPYQVGVSQTFRL